MYGTPYVTPERYRTMGWGLDVSTIDDVELHSMLQSATALVNSYCSVPQLPQPYDFRGGTMTRENSRYDMGTINRAPASRVYVRSKPITAVTELKLIVTIDQYVSFAPEDLYVVAGENVIEIVSLAITSAGLFGAAVFPDIGMRVPVWETTYTYGWTFSSVNERIFATDAKTFRAMNQFWTNTDDVVVKLNGTPLVLTTDYTIDPIEGTVTIVGDVTATDVYTVTYDYTMPSDISTATSIVATTLLGERNLLAKGMGGLAGLRVEEIDLRRSLNPLTRGIENTIPDSARALLEPYVFITVR